MKSWRKKKPKWLCSIIYQFKMICWAIDLIRHYEFRLKHRGLLPLEEHLSIQDFINNTPKHYLDEDGALIVDLSLAAKVLKGKDVLLERDCKLTESLYDAPLSDPDLERFIPADVKVHMMYANRYSDFDQDRSDVFNADLCKHLKGGCVAARITVYPSYNLLKGKEIYYPTNEEVHGLVPNGHVVLLTHYGFDAEDRLFYQFQESYGVETCDKGYAYVYADLVTHFVDMVL
ncbi:hypothetical protein DY000_02057686 [Brassica cretica]|uniref:Peptidase C1A papain C-terminal domain-containing protein n=1 Tax=Brassica cretica TaxID=69181 RepID=A0ABQ7AMF8_BRACR|nr:hypothetical protein DY000_02057686 [Brassica cretica]